jgi:ubiquinone/menaquinone biosynthesis C-methylase UbiE
MTSWSFDAVAHAYDATRGYPEDVVRQLASVLSQAADADAQTRWLEVGVGTGRIALPLAMRGRTYTGLDRSKKMLEQCAAKLQRAGWQEEVAPWGSVPDEDPGHAVRVRRFRQGKGAGMVRLVVGDAIRLPFRDASFEAVVAVHLFHLIGEWQQALKEIGRVLSPGGTLLRCWNERWQSHWQPGTDDIRSRWSQIVQELGGSTSHPGAWEEHVTAWLLQHGYTLEQVADLTWQQEIIPRAMVEGIANRLWTSTLNVPDDLFAVSIERLRACAQQQYGATIDTPFSQKQHMIISAARREAIVGK